jgi:hypothetical protein
MEVRSAKNASTRGLRGYRLSRFFVLLSGRLVHGKAHVTRSVEEPSS